jgi:GT2 family glycosyltransferase
MSEAVVVVPNWNGRADLAKCLDSLRKQSLRPHVIVVDNNSADDSVGLVEKEYPEAELIKHSENKGYAGGVNPGFKRAIELKAKYVAAFNNDAVADKDWLKSLVECLDKKPEAGAAACKLLTADGKKIDSTGDYYTVWGLPYPRGRGETDLDKYDDQTDVFAASGGASLYRVKMLEQIGLLDEDFFAYYEDVDLSFRAQLAGWKVAYVPSAIAYHQISATSRKIKGFAAYQTMKNLQLLWYKNVPCGYRFKTGWRFTLASSLFLLRAITRGQGWAALKGDLKGSWLISKKAGERRRIKKLQTVSNEYIWDMMTHDLPPNARALRKLRAILHPRKKYEPNSN